MIANRTSRYYTHLIKPIIYQSGYYAVGSGIVMFSNNGTNWDSYTISEDVYDISGKKEKLVSVSYTNDRIIYSDNAGSQWSPATYSGTYRTPAYQGSDYSTSQSRWVLSGHDNSFIGVLKYSSDGTTFTQSTISGGSSVYKGPIHWSPEVGKWVCVDDFGNQSSDTYYVYSSTDGQTFSVTATLSAGTYPTLVTGLVYGSSQSRWVMCAYTPPYSGADPNRVYKRIAYSSDLISWTVALIPTNTYLYDITYSPTLGRFVCVGGGPVNSIIYSNDGINWSSSSVVTSRPWRGITWDPSLSQFVVISSSGWITKSSDGITFGTESNITSSTMFNIKYIS